MNLHTLLLKRQSSHRPIRMALIGAGKFSTMFLAQARYTPGLHLLGVADLDPARARAAFERTGWPPEQTTARGFDEALARDSTWITDDADALIGAPGVDVVIEATGNPAAGIRHALACVREGRHLVMVNVEADALAGPLLARRAAEAGLVYSLAYGDQPALICEQVDWARACGFEVVAAGKGTKYRPEYHRSTPDTVWQHYGFTEAQLAGGDFNPQMFNSFLDGTKSAIEMAAVANATGLRAAPQGLSFPPVGRDQLAERLKPASEGGLLPASGVVEVVSSEFSDGRPVPQDLRWGVYVSFTTASAYSQRCFTEYGLDTDSSGRYAALYRPSHLIGMELGISIASVALRGEPTGRPHNWVADVGAVAKRDLAAGEVLDGEGGYTVYGRLLPAADSVAGQVLPIGLAHHLRLARAVTAGRLLTWSDVVVETDDPALSLRREMEAAYGRAD